MHLPSEKNTFLLFILLHLPLLLHSAPPQPKNLLLQTLNTTNSTTYSPWLTRYNNHGLRGCRRRPWICNQGPVPRIQRVCCRNRCVDVSSDVNHCGLCGIRCPFTRQCCRGLCVDTTRNPFNCGRCGHRCRFPSFCIYGLCGYAQSQPQLPPFPCPPLRTRPRPPRPCPPRGGRRDPLPLG